MALGYCPHCNSHQNASPVDSVNNKLAVTSPKAFIKSNNPLTLISQASSCAPTPGPIFISALAPTPTIGKYTDKNLQKATKLILESFFQS